MTDLELVIAAATKVMGWVHLCDLEPGEPLFEDEHGGNHVNWDPLTSDADAFMLVDKMAERGYDFRIHSLPSGAALASFTRAKEPESETSADGPDRRRAIVLAAPKAVEVEG